MSLMKTTCRLDAHHFKLIVAIALVEREEDGKTVVGDVVRKAIEEYVSNFILGAVPLRQFNGQYDVQGDDFVTIQFDVDEEILVKCRELAWQWHTNAAQVFRNAVSDFLLAHAEEYAERVEPFLKSDKRK